MPNGRVFQGAIFFRNPGKVFFSHHPLEAAERGDGAEEQRGEGVEDPAVEVMSYRLDLPPPTQDVSHHQDDMKHFFVRIRNLNLPKPSFVNSCCWGWLRCNIWAN